MGVTEGGLTPPEISENCFKSGYEHISAYLGSSNARRTSVRWKRTTLGKKHNVRLNVPQENRIIPWGRVYR